MYYGSIIAEIALLVVPEPTGISKFCAIVGGIVLVAESALSGIRKLNDKRGDIMKKNQVKSYIYIIIIASFGICLTIFLHHGKLTYSKIIVIICLFGTILLCLFRLFRYFSGYENDDDNDDNSKNVG